MAVSAERHPLSLERDENFPVALRLLPPGMREDLHAVYAFARTVDDLGDRAGGDRTAQLQGVREDLHRIWAGGTPDLLVLQRLAPVVRRHDVPEQPFQDLVEANLMDQRVTGYASFDDLLGYCRLSADPVGRIVLGLLGRRDAATTVLSDRICTALQLLEHWQDVGEDRRAGRVYLPAEDLGAFGVPVDDLDRLVASDRLRRLIRYETERAACLLESGVPLVRALHGWGRVAVAGYVAGGRATVTALRRSGGDVLSAPVRPRRPDVATELAALLSAAALHHRVPRLTTPHTVRPGSANRSSSHSSSHGPSTRDVVA